MTLGLKSATGLLYTTMPQTSLFVRYF